MKYDMLSIWKHSWEIIFLPFESHLVTKAWSVSEIHHFHVCYFLLDISLHAYLCSRKPNFFLRKRDCILTFREYFQYERLEGLGVGGIEYSQTFAGYTFTCWLFPPSFIFNNIWHECKLFQRESSVTRKVVLLLELERRTTP